MNALNCQNTPDQGHACLTLHRSHFYRNWVVCFYQALGKTPEYCFNRDEKEQYLRSLAKDHEPWQVQQADHALRLYLHYLRAHVSGLAAAFLCVCA